MNGTSIYNHSICRINGAGVKVLVKFGGRGCSIVSKVATRDTESKRRIKLYGCLNQPIALYGRTVVEKGNDEYIFRTGIVYSVKAIVVVWFEMKYIALNNRITHSY